MCSCINVRPRSAESIQSPRAVGTGVIPRATSSRAAGGAVGRRPSAPIPHCLPNSAPTIMWTISECVVSSFLLDPTSLPPLAAPRSGRRPRRRARGCGSVHDDGIARLQVSDQLQHLPPLLHTERSGGLVHDHHASALMDRAGDRDGLPLAPRELPDGGAHGRQVDREPREHLARLSHHPPAVDTSHPFRDLDRERRCARRPARSTSARSW